MHRSQATNSSPHTLKVTIPMLCISCDLWIASVSHQSFGVIPNDDTYRQYRLFLDRTRSVFGYSVLASAKKPALTSDA